LAAVEALFEVMQSTADDLPKQKGETIWLARAVQ